ncbi:MAG: NAD-dependent protein deacylase, partial [Lachnospiraceae bacterium]|nr:NAD-dependent protein deacylase [Lachnospiraceae bacterium]
MTQIEQLQEILVTSKNTVFFGGAGVSTESGIPDFRSENGLYHAQQVYGKQPEYLLSYPAFKNEPALFFRYYKENLISLDA